MFNLPNMIRFVFIFLSILSFSLGHLNFYRQRIPLTTSIYTNSMLVESVKLDELLPIECFYLVVRILNFIVN